MAEAVLITGAGGFVAGHIAAGLARLGHEVTACDASFDAAARARLAGCTLIEADLSGPVTLPRADVMIHGAALTTSPAALGITDAQHVAANMAPLMTMLAHAGANPPRAFVFLSSSGVFGASDGGRWLTDTDAATATGPYSAAKKAGEALVPGALGPVSETFVLRLGYLYGPGEAPRQTRQRVSLLQGWLDAAARGETLETDPADPRRDWTFAPDLAPAIAALVTAPGRAAPIHLCNPEAPADSAVAAGIAALYPAAAVTRGPAAPPIKPPMQPSNLPAIRAMRWTPLAQGLAHLAQGRAAA